MPGARRGAFAAALLSPALFACAQPGPPQAALACAAPLKPAIEVSLYFGRGKPSGGEVSDAEWATFLSGTVTPRFPDGLTVIDAAASIATRPVSSARAHASLWWS